MLELNHSSRIAPEPGSLEPLGELFVIVSCCDPVFDSPNCTSAIDASNGIFRTP